MHVAQAFNCTKVSNFHRLNHCNTKTSNFMAAFVKNCFTAFSTVGILFNKKIDFLVLARHMSNKNNSTVVEMIYLSIDFIHHNKRNTFFVTFRFARSVVDRMRFRKS